MTLKVILQKNSFRKNIAVYKLNTILKNRLEISLASEIG
jgi:hypothetical protein